MAAAKDEVGIEVISDLQSGFCEASNRTVVRKQFGFERTPTGLVLGVLTGVACRIRLVKTAFSMCARQTKLVYYPLWLLCISKPIAGWRSAKTCFVAANTSLVGIC